MTWNEFKEEVERQLRIEGLPLDTGVWYIDVSSFWNDKNRGLNVFTQRHDDGRIEVGIN